MHPLSPARSLAGASWQDYRWLLGGDALRWLDEAQAWQVSPLACAGRLRKSLTQVRAALVVEQIELRRRALRKFRQAAKMFFTPLALQQATDETVAAYKAQRFGGQRVLDLCCGIGGDLAMLARRGPAAGLDHCRVPALLAQANCLAALGGGAGGAAGWGAAEAEVGVADVTRLRLPADAAWHIDPDRRPEGRRGTRVVDHQPNQAAVEALLRRSPQAAVKLAPACQPPQEWSGQCELEWISRGGECRQLVAWFGRLAGDPGRRRATVLTAAPGDSGQGEAFSSWTLVGSPGGAIGQAARVQAYVYEPDAAVLAAQLTAELAERHGLLALGQGGYLTGPRMLRDPGMSGFEVEEVMPFDVKRVRGWLRQRGIGRLEIKKRLGKSQRDTSADLETEQVRRRLDPRGDRSATLLLAQFDGAIRAILAHRL